MPPSFHAYRGLLGDPGLSKAAAPKWMQMLRMGKLSTPAVQKITAAQPAGAFRTVRNLGQGAMNLADLVAGNVGGQSGLMVRKVPTYAPLTRQGGQMVRQGLAATYQPMVEASKQLERVAPGVSMPYLAATPKGVFQAYDSGANSIMPRVQPTGFLRNTPPALPSEEAYIQQALRLKKLLEPHGFADIKPANLGPSGRVIDFTKRYVPSPVIPGQPQAITRPPIDPMLSGIIPTNASNDIEHMAVLPRPRRPSPKFDPAAWENNAVRRFHALGAQPAPAQPPPPTVPSSFFRSSPVAGYRSAPFHSLPVEGGASTPPQSPGTPLRRMFSRLFGS